MVRGGPVTLDHENCERSREFSRVIHWSNVTGLHWATLDHQNFHIFSDISVPGVVSRMKIKKSRRQRRSALLVNQHNPAVGMAIVLHDPSVSTERVQRVMAPGGLNSILTGSHARKLDLREFAVVVS